VFQPNYHRRPATFPEIDSITVVGNSCSFIIPNPATRLLTMEQSTGPPLPVEPPAYTLSDGPSPGFFSFDFLFALANYTFLLFRQVRFSIVFLAVPPPSRAVPPWLGFFTSLASNFPFFVFFAEVRFAFLFCFQVLTVWIGSTPPTLPAPLRPSLECSTPPCFFLHHVSTWAFPPAIATLRTPHVVARWSLSL